MAITRKLAIKSEKEKITIHSKKKNDIEKLRAQMKETELQKNSF